MVNAELDYFMAEAIKDSVNKLFEPISELPTLLSLLAPPLDAIGILPPRFRKYSSQLSETSNVIKHIPIIQRTLLDKVLPTWDQILKEKGLSAITDQYFCPDSFSYASTASGQVVLFSYSTILSLPLNNYSIHFLSRLAKEYPVDRMQQAVFTMSSIAWEDCVRNIIGVPAKVANFLGSKGDIPDNLEHGEYFNHISIRTEHLVCSLSAKTISQERVEAICYLLTKLVHVGVFPQYQPASRSQPSFFHTCLPTIRERVQTSDDYSRLWSTIFANLPSSAVTQSIFLSLFACIKSFPIFDTSPQTRRLVKQESAVLQTIVGELSEENHELWDTISAIVIGREWDESKARVLVCWVGVRDAALEVLLSKVLDIWTATDHIKHSLLSRHHYVTSLLLLTISYLSKSSSETTSLALSPSFISGVGVYIKHLDPNVRRCGMLVAEEVARRTGKNLDFGAWDGESEGLIWVRSMRSLISVRDIDFDEAEIPSEVQLPSQSSLQPIPIVKSLESSVEATYDVDSDDESVQGYAASDASDRSPSPTQSDLDDIEKDPTLNVGIKKIPRPVYLVQLGELVRSTSAGLKSGENDEPQKIEMALSCGEELIRRKRSFGTELEENAVNLVFAFVGLQNTYELDGFEANRQAIVTALVACCPRKAAPAIIEEFFKNQYSTDQRFMMLTALALGARESASLPVPLSSVSKERTSFPSKRLPPSLHQRLIAGDPVQRLLLDISQNVIKKSKDNAEDRVPEIVRERQLRLRRPPKITSASSPFPNATIPLQAATFTEIAAEFFICPLINRFWLFLRDEQTRETRSSYHTEPLYRYRGSGTGLVLNPVVLAQLLSALGVLVHAARNAPQWLAVVAPEGLELAVTLGTRPISMMEDEPEDADEEQVNGEGGRKGKEALVLTTALELAVVVLDGCLELDGGRSLGLEHASLLLGTGEWAGKLLSHLEKGVLVPGGGGAQEVRLRRAAAGVVLKVDELTSKWRGSMIDVF